MVQSFARGKQLKLIDRITGIFARNIDKLPTEDPIVDETKTPTTRLGTTHKSITDFFATEFFFGKDEYLSVVADCTRLSEFNPVFSAIVGKLSRTVAQIPTQIEVTATDKKSKAAKEILDTMLGRIQWEENKETYIRRMLNEGGLSWESVLNPNEDVLSLEYRPHHTIHPNLDSQANFKDTSAAYSQYTLEGEELTQFAKWQIVDLNYLEASDHNRGMPHLQSARLSLNNMGAMLKGMMQRWSASGSLIEHFATKEGGWGAIEQFKAENADALEASPDKQLRQFFSDGEFTIERLSAAAGSGANQDSAAIDMLIEIIFFACGVSKEVMGFKGHAVIKDMAVLALINFHQTLNHIQNKIFHALKQVCDFQLLLKGILPEDVDYTITGGSWNIEIPPNIQEWMLRVTDVDGKMIVSVNDIRRMAGLPVSSNPLHNIPGELQYLEGSSTDEVPNKKPDTKILSKGNDNKVNTKIST